MIDRRAVLHGLGVASASTLLAAFSGCGSSGPTVRRADTASREVRTWLRDAAERLAAVYPSVHVLAVQRQRTIAAIDVLGANVARARRDGVVLTVRDRGGVVREHATSDLSAGGVLAAVRALASGSASARAKLSLPRPPASTVARPSLDDGALTARVAELARRDRALNSRVVYAAASIDSEDATVWSISPTHDREHHSSRIIKRVTRAAWNGTRPVVTEAVRGWQGGVDDHDLDEAEIEHATRMALLLVTPGTFVEKPYSVVLEPELAATLVDAATHALLTTAAGRRPEVKRRLAPGQGVASPLLTLVDDPTTPSAYGGFPFDDEGQLASPLTLLQGGRVVDLLGEDGRGRARRPGHVGPLAASASHLRLAAGTGTSASLYADGFVLEGALEVVADASTSRIVLAAARAREIAAGKTTGRVWADVELVGDLGDLLAAVDGISAESRSVPLRSERDGEPTWRSVDAPYVRTRGVVRARRRRT